METPEANTVTRPQETVADAAFYDRIIYDSEGKFNYFIPELSKEVHISYKEFTKALKEKSKVTSPIIPVGNRILIATYFTDSALSVNLPEKDNKSISPVSHSVVVAVSDDLETNIKVGDVIIIDPNAAPIRMYTSDILDRRNVQTITNKMKNRDYENLIHGINRIPFRILLLVSSFDVIAVRNDT